VKKALLRKDQSLSEMGGFKERRGFKEKTNETHRQGGGEKRRNINRSRRKVLRTSKTKKQRKKTLSGEADRDRDEKDSRGKEAYLQGLPSQPKGMQRRELP